MKHLVRFAGWPAAAMLVAVLGTTPTWAASILGLYSTGVDNSGTPAPSGIPDLHYRLVSVPGGGAGTNWVVDFGGDWAAATPHGKWIAPSSVAQHEAIGEYVYRLTFNLVDDQGQALDPRTARLAGNWAADDSLRLVLNEIPVATNTTGRWTLAPFTVTSGFRAGTNTLDFIVGNVFTFTGLIVSDLSGTAEVLGPRASIRVSQVEICYNTFSNHWCQLQYRSALTTNQWVPFTTNWLLGDGTTICTNDAVIPGEPTRFYRVAVTNTPLLP